MGESAPVACPNCTRGDVHDTGRETPTGRPIARCDDCLFEFIYTPVDPHHRPPGETQSVRYSPVRLPGDGWPRIGRAPFPVDAELLTVRADESPINGFDVYYLTDPAVTEEVEDRTFVAALAEQPLDAAVVDRLTFLTTYPSPYGPVTVFEFIPPPTRYRLTRDDLLPGEEE